MKLIVVGPRGKMGRLITKIATERDDLELVAGIGPKEPGFYTIKDVLNL